MAHNIICLEGEWQYAASQPTGNRFNLNTAPLLNWLKEYYDIDVIHRNILNRDNLEYYLRFLSSSKREFKKYKIMYIACHGWHHALSLEGEDGKIDLEELADISGDFFKDRIVHFSSCRTLANPEKILQFKDAVKARLVCGYTKSVNPTKSAIADIALFNDLMSLKNVGHITNKERSKFWQSYRPLLEELGFEAI